MSFSVLKLYLEFVEFAELFSYQYLCSILQVVVSTGVLTFFAQVSIFILTQVLYLHLYLLKEKTIISKNLTNLTYRINEKLKSLQRQKADFHRDLIKPLWNLNVAKASEVKDSTHLN